MKWGLFIVTIGLLFIGAAPLYEGSLMAMTIIQGLVIVVIGIIVIAYSRKKEKRAEREAELKNEESEFNKARTEAQLAKAEANRIVQKRISDEKKAQKKQK